MQVCLFSSQSSASLAIACTPASRTAAWSWPSCAAIATNRSLKHPLLSGPKRAAGKGEVPRHVNECPGREHAGAEGQQLRSYGLPRVQLHCPRCASDHAHIVRSDTIRDRPDQSENCRCRNPVTVVTPRAGASAFTPKSSIAA